MIALRFCDWSSAYDACREANRPMIAIVGDEEAKIFPSGAFKPLNAAAAIAAAAKAAKRTK